MKYTLLLLFAVGVQLLNAQTVKNHMIVPAAGAYASEGISGYWSLGEVENGNRSVGNVLVVQGFAKSNIQAEVTSSPNNLISEVNVFPNPVQDKLHIEWKGEFSSHDLSYSIYDNHGVLIQDSKLASTNQQSIIDLSRLNNGTYILNIFSPRETKPISIRIIKTQN